MPAGSTSATASTSSLPRASARTTRLAERNGESVANVLVQLANAAADVVPPGSAQSESGASTHRRLGASPSSLSDPQLSRRGRQAPLQGGPQGTRPSLAEDRVRFVQGLNEVVGLVSSAGLEQSERFDPAPLYQRFTRYAGDPEQYPAMWALLRGIANHGELLGTDRPLLAGFGIDNAAQLAASLYTDWHALERAPAVPLLQLQQALLDVAQPFHALVSGGPEGTILTQDTDLERITASILALLHAANEELGAEDAGLINVRRFWDSWNQQAHWAALRCVANEGKFLDGDRKLVQAVPAPIDGKAATEWLCARWRAAQNLPCSASQLSRLFREAAPLPEQYVPHPEPAEQLEDNYDDWAGDHPRNAIWANRAVPAEFENGPFIYRSVR